MSDLIDRQAAIDRINGTAYAEQIKENMIFILRMLPSVLSTNLAEVGTDCISRQEAIDLLKQMRKDGDMVPWEGKNVFARIRKLPPAQPEIIRCKDCKFWTHIKRTNRYWCKTDDGLYDLNPSPNDFCSRAERRTE